MDMEEMDKKALVKDCNGNAINEGSAVCILTSGNFIYGHIKEVLGNGKVKVIPDIGHVMTKPNFRLKSEYIVDSESVGLVHDTDTIVDETNSEVVV